MSKVVKKAAPLLAIAAPFAAPLLAPALGITSALGTSALGAGLGAGAGALSGGGLKSALLGAVSGGLGAGGANAIGKAAGLTGTGLKAASGALTGASLGAQNGGGLKGALIGGALGGVGNAALGALSDPYAAIEAGDAAGASLFDKAAGGFAESGVGQALSRGASAIDGSLSSALPSAGTGAGGSSFVKTSNLLSALNSGIANERAEDDLIEQQRRAEGALNPYLQGGRVSNERLMELLGLSGNPGSEGYGSLGRQFNASDFQADPGYEFRKQEGQNALDRTLAGRNKFFSGQAIKAGQEYGQELANQEYQDAYNRWRQGQMDIYNRYANQSASGQNAANSAADIYTNIGNVKANAGIEQSNLLNKALSSILGNSGGRKIVGKWEDGTPMYEDELVGA